MRSKLAHTSGTKTGSVDVIRHRLFFFFLVGLSTAIYMLQRFEVPLPRWINNYLNDFLCLPIVLSICLFVFRKLSKQANVLLPLWVTLGMATYYAFYFEYYLPRAAERYTADIYDVFLYFIGAVLFHFYWKLNSSKKATKS